MDRRQPSRQEILFGIIACLTLALFASYLWQPLIKVGSPYLYLEDDAHHFNRTVEMAKTMDFNPHYFNKPSLHFYLRLPVTLGSFEILKSRGEIHSVKEIRTRDPYGLAGYAFTTSHPLVLTANRAFSVALTVGLAILTFIIAFVLTNSTWLSIFPAVVTTLALEITKNVHLVGVDVLMADMCLLSMLLGILTVQRFSMHRLTWCCLFAGLAGSSKYNAAPIALVPVVVTILCHRFSAKMLAICVITVLLGFILGTPYSVIDFTDFLKGVSYELWHYGVAGHVDHTQERGWAQLLFYLNWSVTDGPGWFDTILAGIGVILMLVSRERLTLTFATFPIAYGILMTLQRANFTRNMVVMVPCIAIFAAIGIHILTKRASHNVRFAVALCIVTLLATAQPLQNTLAFIRRSSEQPESRQSILHWIEQTTLGTDIAVAGPLQLPIQIFNRPGVDAFDPEKTKPAELMQQGFEYLVIPSATESTIEMQPYLRTVLRIEGNPELERIPKNPAISVFEFNPEGIWEMVHDSPRELLLDSDWNNPLQTCRAGSEQYCWISGRIVKITLPEKTLHNTSEVTAELEIMSPWNEQHVTFRSLEPGNSQSLELKTAGTWQSLRFSLPRGSRSFYILLDQIHSPASHHVSNDTRRLGIAVRGVLHPHP